ncbi:pentapeptide repeat-containing protein [Promicromonospora sp. NPDC059942]|uniref:pentapeptide repeat-containing protein n=1 Tax=Promicromonospora sp. NPDC059942 TaxID=3347009 RepID=UPI0036551612
METLTIRDTTADLPVLDQEDLTDVSMLQPENGRLSLFNYSGKDLRTLELSGAQFYDGRISEVTAERMDVDQVRLSSVEFVGCDLATLTLSHSRLSRVRFANCRLLGARFDDLVLEDVVFQDCKIDYATLSGVTAKGPVVFVGCSLIETELDGCDLSGVAFEDCVLRATSFQAGTYRSADLRGNNLSVISGAVNLKRVVIDRYQLADLSLVLADELGITIAD